MRLPGMDEHTTDLGPAPERTDDERRAAAGLLDVAGGGRPRGASGSGHGLLVGLQRRAVRQHRRRIAGAAVAGVAALGAVALVVPAVVPGGGSGIVAALGLEDRGAAPSPAPSSGTPSSGTLPPAEDEVPVTIASLARDAFVLTDAQVGAFAAARGAAPGPLGADAARHLGDDVYSSLSSGGWCPGSPVSAEVTVAQQGVDDPVEVDVAPSTSWSATWRADPAARGGGLQVDVDETVVSWASGRVFPADAEVVRAFVEAVGASPVRCDAGDGQDLAGDLEVLPVPLPGTVQAAAQVPGRQRAWRVRTVGAAPGSGAAVDLTVVLAAGSAQEAGRAVVPLFRQALDRVTAREALVAAAEPGTDPWAGPTSTAPRRVVVRPYPAERAGLTLDQVDAVLPGAIRGSQAEPTMSVPLRTGTCAGPFHDPDNFAEAVVAGNGGTTFEAPLDSGTTSVAEWLTNATDVVGLAIPTVPDPACGPAPSDALWQATVLSRAGTDLVVVVHHPESDPERWVVRAAAAADPAHAVGLEVETTASSQADVAAVVVPLLQAAQRQAYAANFVPSAP